MCLYNRLWQHILQHVNQAIESARDSSIAAAQKTFFAHVKPTGFSTAQAIALMDACLSPVGFLNVVDGPGALPSNAEETFSKRSSVRLRKGREAMGASPSASLSKSRPHLYEAGDLLCQYASERMRECLQVKALEEPLYRLQAHGFEHPTVTTGVEVKLQSQSYEQTAHARV